MIVNYSEKGWSMTLQRSHGLLAAQICAHWNKDNQPARWVETLIATAEHDDVSDELQDPELHPDTGGPVNFKMKGFETGMCDQLLEKAFSKSRYIGLLIAQHIRFLYQNDPAAKSYCQQLEKNEKKWLREAGLTQAEVSAGYELLEFCDAFSLIICQGIVQPQNRKMEISSGPDGQSYQLSTCADGSLTVTPWPFEKDTFALSYETRTIPQLAFKDAAEFRKQLEAAQVELQEVKVTRDDAGQRA